MTMTTLLSLPPELLANIFHHLDDASFHAGRLANRTLEQASFTLFGKRFFRKKGYMITTPSLEVLQSVASHEKLRLYVQHVWFNPDCYTYGLIPTVVPIGIGRDRGRVSIMDAEPPYSEEVAKARAEHIRSQAKIDNHVLLSGDGRLSGLLRSAFATLPNLKTVGMRRSEQHNPWGWSRLRDAVGKDPRELGVASNYPTNGYGAIPGPTILYLALIHALGVSGSQIQRFYTDAVQIDAISAQMLPLTVMQEACGALLYLEINVAEKERMTDVFLNRREDDPDFGMTESQGAGLARLLSACPNLRELGLMIFPNRHSQEEGWSQQGYNLLLTHVTEIVQLRNLRRLKLEKLVALPSTLISFLQPSAPHLTSIKLRDIRLLEEEGDVDNNEPWKPVFAFLSTSCPNLSYLLLYHLCHASGGIRFVQTLPPPPRQPGDAIWDMMDSADNFTDYENIAVEVGVPHSDPDAEGAERRAAVFRARETVGARLRALVDGHWYGRNLFSYEMDELLWYTDTSDEEW